MLDESEMTDVADILRLMTHKNAPTASTIKAQIDRSIYDLDGGWRN